MIETSSVHALPWLSRTRLNWIGSPHGVRATIDLSLPHTRSAASEKIPDEEDVDHPLIGFERANDPRGPKQRTPLDSLMDRPMKRRRAATP